MPPALAQPSPPSSMSAMPEAIRRAGADGGRLAGAAGSARTAGAAAPAGAAAIQLGAIVKLVRVLTLGPVCLILALVGPETFGGEAPGRRPPLHHLAPRFVVVFLALMGLRSAGLIPDVVLPPLEVIVTVLTLTAMAALGLGVDPRAVARAGPRTAATAALSAVLIGVLALVAILILPLPAG